MVVDLPFAALNVAAVVPHRTTGRSPGVQPPRPVVGRSFLVILRHLVWDVGNSYKWMDLGWFGSMGRHAFWNFVLFTDSCASSSWRWLEDLNSLLDGRHSVEQLHWHNHSQLVISIESWKACHTILLCFDTVVSWSCTFHIISPFHVLLMTYWIEEPTTSFLSLVLWFLFSNTRCSLFVRCLILDATDATGFKINSTQTFAIFAMWQPYLNTLADPWYAARDLIPNT